MEFCDIINWYHFTQKFQALEFIPNLYVDKLLPLSLKKMTIFCIIDNMFSNNYVA